MFDLFKEIIKVIQSSFKTVKKLYKYIYLYAFDVLDFLIGAPYEVDENDDKAEELAFVRIAKVIKREKYYGIIIEPKFFKIDWRETKSNYNFYNLSKEKIKILPRYFYRAKNYKTPTFNKTNLYHYLESTKNHLWFGLKSIFKTLRVWVLPLVLFLISIYFLSLTRVLPVNTVLFQWFALGMFSYWLISGFVFFIKKYRFAKFTSAVQRFWRRSYILFWLIESCLLVVFIYLTLNATQETSYMLDQINVFKNHLFSWRSFFPKLFLNTVLVILSYLLLLNIKWNIFKKNIPIIIIITTLLTYMLWVEFYQIYHVSNFYANLFWSYDLDERMWSLESDVRRTRIVNHYVMILFLLKFWHIVFIYIFWIFFVLRASELERIRYPVYSANFQNFVILYIMSWIFMYPWIKVISSKFMSTPYFWFYVNNRKLGLRIFFYDIKLVLYAIQDIFYPKDFLFFKKS